jgi:trehalose synthase
MATSIREIHLERTQRLDVFAGLDHMEPLLDELRSLGREVATLLGTRRVWMLNSTASGGGVAEMLPRMCKLFEELGVDVRWLVLETDDAGFFHATKAVHNLLHGAPSPLEPDAAATYEAVNREAAKHLAFMHPDDVLVVHDPQPAGAPGFMLPERRPRLVWRCHIGLAVQTPQTQIAWDFLRPHLAPYERCIFSAVPYIPDEHFHRSGVIAPGIDPLSHKNRDLRPYKMVGILRCAGLIEGPPPPGWACFGSPAMRLVEGRWEHSPVPELLFRPFFLQVSRFDRLKGFQHLMPAFQELLAMSHEAALHQRIDAERLADELARVQLVLAGPDPGGVSDDPEAVEVLKELAAQHAALPKEVAARVHLLRLPMVDVKQNALMVNALQRTAWAVIQNSLREGFGLTVTEALWKAAPMIAANVGGIAIQMRHGVDGLLVDDPTDAKAIAKALLHLFSRPKEAELMGRAGRARVREHFLVLVQVRSWLVELKRLLSSPRPDRGG